MAPQFGEPVDAGASPLFAEGSALRPFARHDAQFPVGSLAAFSDRSPTAESVSRHRKELAIQAQFVDPVATVEWTPPLDSWTA